MASVESQQVRATLSRGTPGTPVEQLRQEWEADVSGVILPAHITVTPVDVAGMTGEWVASTAQPWNGGTILYLHGGGFTTGSCNTHRELAARIAEATAARVLTINYRLAPEVTFPAPVEDVVSAYRWLLDTDHAPDQIAIGGDSAGATLALAALVKLRDEGAPLPAAALLISPLLDLTLSGPTIGSNADVDPLISRASLEIAVRHYLGDHDPRAPLASPLFADLRGLPPILVQAGQHEMLLSDATRLAEKASAAGVDVQLDVWDEMWHVWHCWAAVLPEGRAAIARIGQFVHQQLARLR